MVSLPNKAATELKAVIRAEQAMKNLKSKMRAENDDHPAIKRIIAMLGNMKIKAIQLL